MTEPEIVADVVLRLESAGIPYAIGGSFASSVWGQPRSTNDADIVIRLTRSSVASFRAALGDPYHLSDQDIEEALGSADEYRTIQLMHMDEAFKVDFFVARDGEYEASVFNRASRVSVSEQVQANFVSAENIVLEKLRWFALMNRKSDRQWNDLVQVLETQKGRLDEEYLTKWAEHFNVLDLLRQAQSQVFE